MANIPVGLLVAAIDAADQAAGGPGVVDRLDEKVISYLRGSPGRGSSQGFRWNPSGSKMYDTRRRGGPSKTSPTRRPSYHDWTSTGRGRYVPKKRFKRTRRSSKKKRCPPGYYYSYKARRCIKSKFK